MPERGEWPALKLSNGVMDVVVALPDARRGFYQGTRFDRSGMITHLSVSGQPIYGPWFQSVSEDIHDYRYEDAGLVASTATAATGPAEEFGVLGFDDAKPGESFIKIGVGALTRPDDQAYDRMRPYRVHDAGLWQVTPSGASEVSFVHTLPDTGHGYAYCYTKRLSLIEKTGRMRLSHSLENRGARPMITSVYNHNFLTLDGRPTRRGLKLTAPFLMTIDGARGLAHAVIVEPDGIRLIRSPKGGDYIFFNVSGFGATAADHRFSLTDASRKTKITLCGDRPLYRLVFWSIPEVASIEPFIRLKAEPGETESWTCDFEYEVFR